MKIIVCATIEAFGYLECEFESRAEAVLFAEWLERSKTYKATSDHKRPIVKVRLLEEVE